MPENKLKCLDVFRGFAAITVALYHFRQPGGILYTSKFITNGPRMVDFFFVLSGFIICYKYHSVKNGKQSRDFLIKRFARLYPLHLFMLFVFLGFEILKYILFETHIFKNPAFGTNSIPSFFQNLAMLQAIEKDPLHLTWDYPSWSISAEMFAYLLFALTIVPLNKLKKFQPLTFLIISSVAVITSLTFGDLGYLTLIVPCILGFFLGCFTERLYQVFKTINLPIISFTFLEAILLVGTICCITYLNKSLTIYLFPLYALFILIFANEKGVLSNIIINKYTVWIGALSFSIYMTHALIADVFEVVLRFAKINKHMEIYDLMAIPYLGIVIIISKYTYVYIETKWKKFLLKRFLTKDETVGITS